MGGRRKGKKAPRRGGAPATRVSGRIPAPEAVNPRPVARNTPNTSRARRSSGNRAVRPMKVYHMSLAVDSKMLAAKKKLRSYSVATVVDTTQGVPNAASIAAAMAIQFDPEWQWKIQPFEDGRFFIRFPSPEFARDVENRGTLQLPGVSLSLVPYSDDLFATGSCERECRWVIIKRLPFFLLHRDTVLRILKPLGYLGTLYKGASMDELRACIKVRRGRRPPCTIRCIIDSWQCIVTVDMEPGQEPLPWDTYSPGKGPEPLAWSYTVVEKGFGPGMLYGIDSATWTNVRDALVAMESTYDDDEDEDVSRTENIGVAPDEMDLTTWINTSECEWSSHSSGEDIGATSDDDDEE